VGALLVIEVLVVVAEIVKDRVNDVGRVNFIRDLKTALFQALLSKDLSVLESADLMTTRHAIGNAGYVLSQLFDLPVTALGAGARILTSVALLWRQSPRLSIAMAVLLPARLLLESLLVHARERFELCFSYAPPTDVASNRDVWSMLLNPVAIRTLRLFAREPAEVSRFNGLLRQQDRANTKDKIAHTLFYPLDELLSRLVTVGGLWYGSRLVYKGSMRATDVGAFVTLSSMTFEQIQFMWHFVQQTGNQVLDPVEEMYELLHGSQPAIGISDPPLSSMPADPSELTWDLSMSDVVFRYPSRPGVAVLRGVSLRVSQGERVGLLGSSGCGKSTVLALLARLYDAESGQVAVAGKDVKSWNPLWLRRNVVVVAQTQFFLCRTVYDNLALALQARYRGSGGVDDSSIPDVTAGVVTGADVVGAVGVVGAAGESSSWAQQMEDALRVTRCHEIFFDRTRFPGGWHTDLGKDASKLSGGEKQRLALAMAVLRHPRVLCLDEATSALDEESQFQVSPRRRSSRQSTLDNACVSFAT
jgi:ABC-type multidrug transport system fused ATPase/permease subunit